MIHSLIISVVAGLFLCLGDVFHVLSQTASYPGKWFLFYHIPWWVWPEFTIATLILLRSYPIRRKIFSLNDSNHTSMIIGLNGFWTLMIYLLTSGLPESLPLLKNVVLYSLVFVQLSLLKCFTRGSILDLIQIAAGGCIFEWMLGEQGIFLYSPSPSRFLVNTLPVWLPAIYLSAGASSRLLAVRIGIR